MNQSIRVYGGIGVLLVRSFIHLCGSWSWIIGSIVSDRPYNMNSTAVKRAWFVWYAVQYSTGQYSAVQYTVHTPFEAQFLEENFISDEGSIVSQFRWPDHLV